MEPNCLIWNCVGHTVQFTILVTVKVLLLLCRIAKFLKWSWQVKWIDTPWLAYHQTFMQAGAWAGHRAQLDNYGWYCMDDTIWLLVKWMNEYKSQSLDLELSICFSRWTEIISDHRNQLIWHLSLYLFATKTHMGMDWIIQCADCWKTTLLDFRDWIASCWILPFNEMATYQLVVDTVVCE